MKTIKLLFQFCLIFGITAVSYSQDEIDLLILNKSYSEAVAKIEQQISQNPTSQIYFKKGVVFSNLQKYQEAVKAFSEALKFQPGNLEILSEMAEDLSILGNLQDAIAYYKKAIDIEPNNLALKAKLGRVYISKKEMKKAWDLFSEIHAIDSSNVYWTKQYAFCSFQTGKRLLAVHLYKKVLAANPRDYSTYENLGHTYSR